MRYTILFLAAIFAATVTAQEVSRVNEPESVVVDSRDNVYATLKYGIIKITPDGTIYNLTRVPGTIGVLDKHWNNLIIDSKDNLYASDGNSIYRFTVTKENKAVGEVFAGKQYSSKLLDGPLSTAAFNNIKLMTIDGRDNIYVTDSYDKIKDEIGKNFITDPYFLTDPAKKYVKYPGRNYSVLRKISSGGLVTTIKTPDGKYILPETVRGMTADREGNLIYSNNGFGRFVGKIDLTSGTITSVAGQPYKREWCPVYTQGSTQTAELVEPSELIISKTGEILMTDERLHRIIKIAKGKGLHPGRKQRDRPVFAKHRRPRTRGS